MRLGSPVPITLEEGERLGRLAVRLQVTLFVVIMLALAAAFVAALHDDTLVFGLALAAVAVGLFEFTRPLPTPRRRDR